MSRLFAKFPISEIASVERGKFSARPRNDPQYYGGNIPFLQTGDISRAGRFIVRWDQTLNAQGLAVSRLFPRETILMSIAANVGDVAISTFDAACPDSLVAVIPKNGVNAEWLFQILRHSKEELSSLATQNAQANLSLEKIIPFKVPVPPPPEQRKIAEILRTWDEAIEKLETLRAVEEKRLKGMRQKLLAPSRAIGRCIPRSNWTPISFGEIFGERQDRNTGFLADDVITVGKYAIRKQSDHFKRSVASKDLSKYWIISPGEFVYDPMSAYYGAIGRFSDSKDGIVSPAYRVIRLSPDIDSNFIVEVLRTHHIRFLLETRSSQGNKEGKRRMLQRYEFDSIEFNLPPREIQREITTKLAVFQAELNLVSHKIKTLTRQKRGLMQKLLTGEWRVKPGG